MKSGQSIIEVVVAVGVMALMLSGVVMLMTNTLGSKTRGFDRKKAVEMSEVIIENLLDEKNSNPDSFWNYNSPFWVSLRATSTMANYPGYTYSIAFAEKPGGNCGVGGSWNCAEAAITISWESSTTQQETFTRFFSKY